MLKHEKSIDHASYRKLMKFKPIQSARKTLVLLYPPNRAWMFKLIKQRRFRIFVCLFCSKHNGSWNPYRVGTPALNSNLCHKKTKAEDKIIIISNKRNSISIYSLHIYIYSFFQYYFNKFKYLIWGFGFRSFDWEIN